MTLFIITAGLLVGLVILFYIERRRGGRYAERIRAAGDRVALGLFAWHERTRASFQSNTVQQTFHYLLHIFLLSVSALFRWITTRFDDLIRVNRSLARRASTSGREVERHLVEMMAHKKHTALSDAEKRRRKEYAIGGKL